jgi:WbqC-like protein family
MILSAYQPYFAPYPGYFYKAFRSDLFVLLDEVQFPRGSTWISRNRFKNHQGALWITIPVWKKGLGLQKINEVRICHQGRWHKKHLESLKAAYAKAPYFEDHVDFITEMFSREYECLADLNLAVIRYLMKALHIETRISCLSELGISSTGPRRLAEICRKTGASQFLAQSAARKYLDEKAFLEAGIELTFFNPPSPVYPQLWGDFLPNLSAFDLVFTCGPKAHDILLGCAS